MSEAVCSEKAETISYDQFVSVEIRVGHIVSAESIPKSKKLLQLYIDVGEDKPRSVLAGIAQSFEPDDLVDLHIAVVTNLEPTQIFGRTSQAMILAVENELGKLELARFSKDVKPGTRIR